MKRQSLEHLEFYPCRTEELTLFSKNRWNSPLQINCKLACKVQVPEGK